MIVIASESPVRVPLSTKLVTQSIINTLNKMTVGLKMVTPIKQIGIIALDLQAQ